MEVNVSKICFFLKQNTRDKSRRSGNWWLVLSEILWGRGDQVVRCVKTEDQRYCGQGVQGSVSKIFCFLRRRPGTKSEYQGLRGFFEKAIMGRKKSGSEICESRKLGTGSMGCHRYHPGQ